MESHLISVPAFILGPFIPILALTLGRFIQVLAFIRDHFNNASREVPFELGPKSTVCRYYRRACVRVMDDGRVDLCLVYAARCIQLAREIDKLSSKASVLEMADPKWVVALGDCAADGGIFAGSYAVVGGGAATSSSGH